MTDLESRGWKLKEVHVTVVLEAPNGQPLADRIVFKPEGDACLDEFDATMTAFIQNMADTHKHMETDPYQPPREEVSDEENHGQPGDAVAPTETH